MKANEETLKQKMDVVDENIRYLEEKRNSFDPEKADFGSLQAVKHSLLEIAEACIDIASHIIAAEGFEKPDDYADVFPVLADNDIIEDDLASRLSDMAGFRNFLVHRYDKFDDQRLEKYINEDLEDVREFNEAIYRYMDKS